MHLLLQGSADAKGKNVETENLGIKQRESLVTGTAHLWELKDGHYVAACGTVPDAFPELPNDNIILMEIGDTPCAPCLDVMTFDAPDEVTLGGVPVY